jgi:hypothetical protein
MKREDVFLIEQDSAEPLAWAVSGLRPEPHYSRAGLFSFATLC